MTAVGDLIGERYRVEKVIGEGSTSVVYLVTDVFLSLPLAVKEYKDKYSEYAGFEADILAKLNGSFYPKIYDFLGQNKTKYIVMEYIVGDNLEELIAQKRPDSYLQKSVITSVIDYACKLRYSDNPIIIDDLKPANIIVNDEGNVRFIDAASCRILSDKTEFCFLTDCYSNENARNGEINSLNEIYSLGLLILFVESGVDPGAFDCNIDRELLNKLGIKGDMSELILRCIDSDREDAFKELSDVKDSFELLSSHKRGRLNTEVLFVCVRDILTVAGVSLASLGLYGYIWTNKENGLFISLISFAILLPLICISSSYNEKRKINTIKYIHSVCLSDSKERLLGCSIIVAALALSFLYSDEDKPYFTSTKENECITQFVKGPTYNTSGKEIGDKYISINNGPGIRIDRKENMSQSCEEGVTVALYNR